MSAVLVTGAAGNIGTILVGHLARTHPVTCLDPKRPDETRSDVTWVEGSITDPATVRQLVGRSAYVVHLATGYPGKWDQLREVDVNGAVHVLDAARETGCHRVVLASTNHVVGRFEAELLQRGSATTSAADLLTGPVRPDGPYGAAKAFIEAYGRMTAETSTTAVSCLRIGTTRVHDDPERYLDQPDFAHLPGGREGVRARLSRTWLTHADLRRIVDEELAATEQFRLRFAVSDNPGRFWPLDVHTWDPPVAR